MNFRAIDAPGFPSLADQPNVDRGGRMRFAFLAETSRCLADSLDYQTTLATAASLALPQFGSWCMVDIVEPDDSIRRAAVIHPDPAKQQLARDYYLAHPPGRDDPIGAPRVIRTHHSEFSALAVANALEDIADVEHRELLEQLGAKSFLIVPMRARGRTLGAITFVSDDHRRYDDADLLLAEDLGRRCAMAIDNARLYGMAEEARRAAESAREDATFAAQRANALREVADGARHEAEAANGTKATFLTTMSHEFRTPLGAVLGYVGLLNEELAGPLTPVQRNYLRRIGNATGSLLRLIEEVLTLSQVQAGHGRINLEEVDVSAIVREVADLLMPLIGGKNLTLAVDLPEAPILFPTDASKLRQIVINLAANALKFTRVGEVRLGVSENETEIVLTVRDTGEGMAPGEVERLFEPFSQVGPASQRMTRGTGLGLSITRQLAGLMSGSVDVDSTVGVGSTFTVRLPRLPSSGPSAAALADAKARERRARERAAVP